MEENPYQSPLVNEPAGNRTKAAERRSARTYLIATVCGLAFAEWLFFELLRTPYRPPHDMLTLLGTEKYAVILLMVGILILGVPLVVWQAVRSIRTTEDVAIVAAILTAVVATGVIVFFFPGRAVTPLKLMLR